MFFRFSAILALIKSAIFCSIAFCEHILGDLDLAGDGDHLRVPLEIAFFQGRFLLFEVGHLPAQRWDRAGGGDIADLEDVLLVLEVVLDLLVEVVQTEQFQLGLGQVGIHLHQAARDHIEILFERDKVVVPHVLIDFGLGGLGLVAQLLDPGVEVGHREIVGPADVVGQIVHEHLDVLVRHQGGRFGVRVKDGDLDQVGLVDGRDRPDAEPGAQRSAAAARGGGSSARAG